MLRLHWSGRMRPAPYPKEKPPCGGPSDTEEAQDHHRPGGRFRNRGDISDHAGDLPEVAVASSVGDGNGFGVGGFDPLGALEDIFG